jgi:hypothetical protein
MLDGGTCVWTRIQEILGVYGQRGLWTNPFSSDAAFMFPDPEMERHVQAIEDIFADEDYRFRLDEDAEAELIPRLEIMLPICNNFGGVVDKDLEIGARKARYLEMYDDQIDRHADDEEYKHKRWAVIVDTFDRLIAKQKAQWTDNQDDIECYGSRNGLDTYAIHLRYRRPAWRG